MKITIALLVVIFLFFFGCTEMTRDEVNTCYSLTSKSFDYIPYCETTNSCYARLNTLFKTNFEIPTENDLYHLKNSVARSWFYYNKSIKEIENISKQCLTKNASTIPGQVNQTRFYIKEAFNEMDKYMKKSFEIILKEYKFLDSEDIKLIPEEKIYDDYIYFKQILTELESGSTKSNSYISFFTKKVENFKNSNSDLPSNLIEKDSFYMQALNITSNKLLDELELNNVKIDFYFLSTPINNLFTYFEDLIYKKQSITALSQLPTNQLMILYSDLTGEKHSALEQFSLLINNYNENFKQLSTRKIQLWENVENEYNTTKNLRNSSKDNENIEYIRTNLVSEKIISNTDIEKLFLENENRLILLRKDKFENRLTIGKEISNLKEINNNFLILTKHYLEKKFENNTLITNACDKKASDILKIKNDSSELEKIYSDLIFYAKQTLNSADLKPEFCKKTIQKEKEYFEGKNNFELLKAKQIDITKECFSFLDEVFLQSNFNELKKIYEQLKKETVTNENIFYFKEACEKIKMQVENEIYSNKNIIEIENNYKILNNLKNELILVEQYSKKSQKPQINEIEKEINFYNNYRQDNKFDYIKIINIIEELNERLIMFNQKTITYLDKEKIETIINNIKFINHSKNLIVANTDFNSEITIEIHNPFKEISKEVSFKVPFKISIQNVDFVKDYLTGENQSVIILSKIPFGTSKIIASYKNKIEYEIIEKIILATNKESLIEKRINIKNDEIFSKSLFSVESQKHTKLIITLNKKEISYVIENNKINFVLDDVSKNSEIILYFYINDLITLEKNIKDITNIDLENQTIEYELKLKNNIGKKLNSNILIDFKNDFYVKKINIYDEKFTNKQITIINDQILLKNIEFIENEQKTFVMVAQINNSKEYYSNQLLNLKNNLFEINNFLSKEIEKHLTYKFSEEWLKTAQKLINQANKEIEQDNILKAKENQILLVKNELIEKISIYENILLELKELNLLSDFDKLQNVLGVAKENLNSSDEKKMLSSLILLNDLNFDIDSKIKGELNTFLEKLSEIDPNQNFIADEIKNKIYNLLNSKNSLSELKSNFLKIKIDYENFLKSSENNEINKISKINELKNKINDAKNLIYLLRKELSIDSEKLVEIRFIPPITISRLDKLELSLNSNKENEFLEKEFEIINIHNELLSAYSDIKKQAITKFNESVENNFDAVLLKNAKENIDNNNYILSMFSLNEKQDNNFNIIGIVPIILILIILIVIAIYSKKNNKDSKKIEDEIKSSWED